MPYCRTVTPVSYARVRLIAGIYVQNPMEVEGSAPLRHQTFPMSIWLPDVYSVKKFITCSIIGGYFVEISVFALTLLLSLERSEAPSRQFSRSTWVW